MKEKIIEKLTVTAPLSAIDEEMIEEFTALVKANPGNAELYFHVQDEDGQMYVNLMSRVVKIDSLNYKHITIMALEIKDSNFDELLNAGKPMVVDFWATWCGPCKKIAPDVEALAEQYKDQVVVGKCDVDDNDELTGRFGVRNIPTVLFIKDGKVQDKTVGAVTKAELEEKLKALL